MKIELRKISYSKALSQETSAYAAEIWVDGKKRGNVRNQGHGGADMVYPHDLAREIEEYAKTLPPVPASKATFNMELAMSTELVLGELLEKHLAAKDLKSALRRKVLFTRTDGKLYEVRGTARPTGPDVAKVLNDLPFEEALSIFTAPSA
jgi:hypothetical protein